MSPQKTSNHPSEINLDFVPRSQYNQLLKMLAESEHVIYRRSEEILFLR